MKIEALPDDFIDSLIAEPVVKTTFTHVCSCGSKLDNGYCRNPDCEWDAQPEVVICPHCGSCEDPDTCVWGVQCPECYSPPHEHCLDSRGSKTGLHEARWEYAGRSWRKV